ncbi:hypothetical protein FQR65_LT07722 [Abscondita terminalis]|nr:hypothetical protein FQR65_LT07722 [Abscondita terminalis]
MGSRGDELASNELAGNELASRCLALREIEMSWRREELTLKRRVEMATSKWPRRNNLSPNERMGECEIDVISGKSEISDEEDPTFLNESDISISVSEDRSEAEANSVPEVAPGEMINSNT